MPYKKQISVMLKRFGQPVEIISEKGGSISTAAFIQPSRSANRDEREVSSLGEIDGDSFVYIGPPSPELAIGDFVKSRREVFIVCSAEAINVGGETLYFHAVLKRAYLSGEADG